MKTLITGGTPNREEFLTKTNNGLDYFNLQYGGKLVLNGTGDKCKNVKSKLYDDKNGSVSIYKCKDDKYRFKDYGNPEHHGDVFDYASLKYGISVQDNFPLLLDLMNQEMESKEALVIKKSRTTQIVEERKVVKVDFKEKEFTKTAIDFWNANGISEKTLK